MLSSTQMCDILNKFSHVLFHGDSLTRHMWSGLRTGLTNNFEWNGMIDPETSPNTRSDCRCDGQLSGTHMCRQYADDAFDIEPQEFGFCPHLAMDRGEMENDQHAPFKLQKIGTSVPKIDEKFFPPDVDCTDPNYKGVLLSLAGGLHFHLNATNYIERVLEPLLNHPVLQSCAAEGKLILIWHHVDMQASVVDDDYPHQDEKHKLMFTQIIDEYLDIRGFDPLARIYWLELTRLAETSDGVHKLMNGTFTRKV